MEIDDIDKLALQAIRESGLLAQQAIPLPFEAARTIILGQEKLWEQADRCDISIVALK